MFPLNINFVSFEIMDGVSADLAQGSLWTI
jgi:hypothetical protein